MSKLLDDWLAEMEDENLRGVTFVKALDDLSAALSRLLYDLSCPPSLAAVLIVTGWVVTFAAMLAAIYMAGCVR